MSSSLPCFWLYRSTKQAFKATMCYFATNILSSILNYEVCVPPHVIDSQSIKELASGEPVSKNAGFELTPLSTSTHTYWASEHVTVASSMKFALRPDSAVFVPAVTPELAADDGRLTLYVRRRLLPSLLELRKAVTLQRLVPVTPPPAASVASATPKLTVDVSPSISSPPEMARVVDVTSTPE